MDKISKDFTSIKDTYYAALSENYKPILKESPSNSTLFGVYFIKIEAEMTTLCCFEK